MEDNKSKKGKGEELFAPYADENEEMTAEEVEKFMQDWPEMLKELEKKRRQRVSNSPH